VAEAVIAHLHQNPGAVCKSGERSAYSDGFRRFVVDLAASGQPGSKLPLSKLTRATGVPVGTLKDWLRAPVRREIPACVPITEQASPCDPPADKLTHTDTETAARQPAQPTRDHEATASSDAEPTTVRSAHEQLIVDQWPLWKGTFLAFCVMLRTQHRLPCGDTFIGDVLQAFRLRDRRPQQPVEAPWSSNTFRSLFPGAQWLGDGTSIAVHWGSHVFVFNVEALQDVTSNAVVGFRASDSEDEEALRLTYEMGLETTGGPPLSVSLDNRPSNHSPGTLEALSGTTVLAATPGRGQAKAAVEGGFGLFQQTMPPLVVDGATWREMARCVLELVMTAWYRGRNGKPRERLKGKTPKDAYLNARPTQKELDEALAWIRELQRRQELMRRTREARQDPVRIELLKQGLLDLGIPDPKDRLAVALACYSREAIAYGLAAYRTKLNLDTLPLGADPGRYLGGIIRNQDTRLQLDELSKHLLDQRIRLRDLSLAPLTREAEQIRSNTPTAQLPQVFIDRALEAKWEVDFRFWAQAATTTIAAMPAHQRASLYPHLCRRIAASFKTDRRRREDLIGGLAEAAASAAA
jgi:transposase InsO family protein